MAFKRVIPCLDVDNGRVVKGINFLDLRDAGDPVELAERYDHGGADEIVFLDVTATSSHRSTAVELASRVAERIFVPFTIGGGIRSPEDAQGVLDAGADKVAVNSAAVADPTLISRMADRFGSQCVVLAVDARERASGGSWEVFTAGGRKESGREAIEWIREGVRLGAGEILLTSMDRDGTQVGYDLDLLNAAAKAVEVPIIASGGAGSPQHMAAAFETGADAALLASILHDGVTTVETVKNALLALGVDVRPIAA
ncbi:MAG: imidazole glycerol phosphate synthase subunit HisF [Actinobacteria bacterium]|uniref:imidazole glycerol-phosphate synthase n=1 Tax=freshwater metagenome TaxID=449393 RepID=A0A6J7E4B9_9ZZZZ|nr:imidazole glycerol phosphate synthase subunit HisF [Actinomycetota bacterium]